MASLSRKDKELGKALLIEAIIAVVKRWWRKSDPDRSKEEKPSKND